MADPERRDAFLDLALWSAAATLWIAARFAGVPLALGIGVIALTLAVQVLLVVRRRRERARDFGLRTDNIRAAAPPIAAFTALGTAVAIGAAIATGASVSGEFWLVLALYPLWGVVQQLVIQGVILRRISVLVRSKPAAIAIAAAAFALLHVSIPLLVPLTFAAGLVWSWAFSRAPNVWLLGLSHGVLAALAYPFLLDVDPLAAR